SSLHREPAAEQGRDDVRSDPACRIPPQGCRTKTLRGFNGQEDITLKKHKSQCRFINSKAPPCLPNCFGAGWGVSRSSRGLGSMRPAAARAGVVSLLIVPVTATAGHRSSPIAVTTAVKEHNEGVVIFQTRKDYSARTILSINESRRPFSKE